MTAFDHMHNNTHNTSGKHILPELRCHVEDIGDSKMDKIDEQYVLLAIFVTPEALPHPYNIRMAALPRWWNLLHFMQVMSVDFADTNKLEDILENMSPSNIRCKNLSLIIPHIISDVHFHWT